MVPKTEKTPVEEDEKMETADEVGDENVDTTNEIKDEKVETPNGVEDEKVETKNEIKDEKVETTNEVEDEKIETKTEVKVEKLETTDEEEDEKMETTNEVEDEKVETKNKIKDEKVETTNEVEDEEVETTNEVKVEKLETTNGEEDEKMETANEPEGNEIITKREDLTPFFKKRDHSVNQVHQSEVPQICKDEPCQLGVDEAGRGPVLGPMVYGISYAPLSQKKLLVDLGCADSKTLTEDKRDAIFDKICDNSDKMGWAIDSISPNYIANCMYRRCKTSLNEVSMDAAIGLIRKTIEAGVFVAEIYVDTVGKPEKYQAKLEGIFPGIKITVAKKADSTYPIVSAASICAKVSRDHALRAWQFREVENETEYGSGYPNDPLTKKWLADNVDPIFGFPQLVRFSWSTAEKILESKAISVEWEDPEEDSSPNEVKISKFFAPSPKATKQNEKTRHKFFTNRCLSSATTI